MTFPQIADADTQSGTVTSNTGDWTLTYPTNIAAGDLLLMLSAIDGQVTVEFPSMPSGWVVLVAQANPGNAVHLDSYYKIADGSETGTFTFSRSSSEQGAWRIFRITNWHGTTPPALLFSSGSGDATPNPPNLNPGTWDVEDTLWFAVCAADTSRTISVWPLADRQTADVSGGANGATLGVCTTESAVASLDPGTFTISASDDWCAATIAIRPVAAVEAVPRGRPIYPQLLAH